MKYQIFNTPPKDFNPIVEAAGCYCAFEDKILYLKRHPNSPQGNTWGVPAGKFEKGENARQAVVREVKEEAGLDIDDAGLEEIGKLYIRLPHVDYVYHMFCKFFHVCPTLTLGLEEHLDAKWVTYFEALELPLIAGGIETLNFFKMFIERKRDACH